MSRAVLGFLLRRLCGESGAEGYFEDFKVRLVGATQVHTCGPMTMSQFQRHMILHRPASQSPFMLSKSATDKIYDLHNQTIRMLACAGQANH